MKKIIVTGILIIFTGLVALNLLPYTAPEFALSNASEDEYFKNLQEKLFTINQQRAHNNYLQANGKNADLKIYKYNLDAIKNMKAPETISEAHQKIIHGIESQIAYFEELTRTGKEFDLNNAYVKTANDDYAKASELISAAYANESSYNLIATQSFLAPWDFSKRDCSKETN